MNFEFLLCLICNARALSLRSLERQRLEATAAITAQTEALVTRLNALSAQLVSAVEKAAEEERQKVASKLAEVETHAGEAKKASRFVEVVLEHSR